MSEFSLVDKFSAHHRRLLLICDELEAIADSLPDRVCGQKCLRLARGLGATMTDAQQLEESKIFPTLLALEPLREELVGTLEQLRSDHHHDLCYAEEVQETLRAYGEGRRSVSPDAAGFMLRGFFEGLRRHIAFEQHLIGPLLHLAEGRTMSVRH